MTPLKKNVGPTLIELSREDAQIFTLYTLKKEIEHRLSITAAQIQSQKNLLLSAEKSLVEQSDRQKKEEQQLRDEEHRIIERRKQITAIGGAKVGKFMERELDIATRAMQSLEENALKALEGIDQLQNKTSELKEQLEQLQQLAEKDQQESVPKLEQILAELESFQGRREKLISSLEERVRRLYERVLTRYPGSPIALADAGACQSCFRALPTQTYNQILAGNVLIQCPGCMRILVHVEGKGE